MKDLVNFFTLLLTVILLSACTLAPQRDVPGHTSMHHEPGSEMPDMDMSSMDHQHHHHPMNPSGDAGAAEDPLHSPSMSMASPMSMPNEFGGPYKQASSIGSGTSLNPVSNTYMWDFDEGDWSWMLHGDVKAGVNIQGGPRGVTRFESQNWFMAMGQRTVGDGQWMVRGMFSLEPLTTPAGGFPELFQTGETYHGRSIVDAQHPHNLVMELATSYTQTLAKDIDYYFYLGLIGEPALGPPAFMHRLSAMSIPAAPLTHHWMDSTHISSSVATVGGDYGKFRMEGSTFHGQEPGENRFKVELGAPDSWSVRLWYLPSPEWAFQISHGHIKNPERLSPGDVDRTTASASYVKTWDDGYWANTLAWGLNQESHGSSNGFLVESTVNFQDRNYVFMRGEVAGKHGLTDTNVYGRPGLPSSLADPERQYTISALTLGYERSVYKSDNVRVNLGVDATLTMFPASLKPIYGTGFDPSFQFFIHITPGKM